MSKYGHPDRGYDLESDVCTSVDPHLLDSVEIDYTMYDFWENEPMDRTDDLIVERLSISDQKLYHEYYLNRLTQTQVAELLGISQFAVCKALQVLQRRLVVLRKLPRISWNNTIRALQRKGQEDNIRVLKSFIKTTSQQLTAEDLTTQGYPMTQGRIRTRLKQLVEFCGKMCHYEQEEYLITLMTEGKILHNRR
jgi:predicted transcriptional regulator